MTRTRVDRLVDHLTDSAATDAADDLTADLRAWVEGSRRFRAFAETHRDKIRKKVRATRGTEPRLDLRAELAVAQVLLADRRIELAYEGYGSTVGGPDFTVSFRGHLAFNLEVTRWRGDPGSLPRQLVNKLRQLRPSVANAILVAVDVDGARPPALDALLGELGEGITDGPREMRARLRRLGGAFAWADRRSGPERATLWISPTARIPLGTSAARAVLASLRDAPMPPNGPITAQPM
jgi:hypothetical protein